MDNTICLDEGYSTTRLVTKEQPELKNNPDDKFETLLYIPEGEGRQGEGGLRTKGYFKKSLNDKPLITVVTVVYNDRENLEETILSVINQTYDNVEYIIIDGGSTDGTLDIIKKYENSIDYWVSEKDNGIYDAMNKGIRLSTGVYCNLLNSGDYFGLKHLEEISLTVKGCYRDIIYSDYYLYFKEMQLITPRKSTLNLYFGMTISHQSLFIPISVYKKEGLYSLDYKLASDYELLLRLFFKKYNFVKCYKTNELYFLHGGLSDISMKVSKMEANIINKKYYGKFSFKHLLFITKNTKDIFFNFIKRWMVFCLGDNIVLKLRKFKKRFLN